MPYTRTLLGCLLLATSLHAELTPEQQQVPLEVLTKDASLAKVVLIAGSTSNKPGQHEYFAGCALLMDWLKAAPGVPPIMVTDGWPKNEAVLLFLDGGTKLPFLEPTRWAKMQSLAYAGTGFIVLHQGIDCSPDKYVHHILACPMPDNSRKTEDAKAHPSRAETVAWSYERPNGGRSFGFTGCDLHANWADANQRLLVLNGILWAAKLDVPASGLASEVTPEALKQNWDRKVFLKKAAKAKP